MQTREDSFERLQDSVLSAKFTESLCLISKNGGDGLDGITVLELLGEWVLGQWYARLVLVVLQSNLKEYL